MNPQLDYETSCGNVFADLELPFPEERLAKAKLAYQISARIKRRRLSQVRATKWLGLTDAQFVDLTIGRVSHFSLEQLMSYLMRLGLDIEMSMKIKPRHRPQAMMTVVYAQ